MRRPIVAMLLVYGALTVRAANVVDEHNYVGNVAGIVVRDVDGAPLPGSRIHLVETGLLPAEWYGTASRLSRAYLASDLSARLDTPHRTAVASDDGTFLINFVPTPYPFHVYDIVAIADGYDPVIVLGARVLPGAVMSLEATIRMTVHTGFADVFLGDSAEAPYKYLHEKQVASAAIAEVTAPNQIYATREGLVGRTTANGHVIQSRDHFVALPSRVALASNNGYEFQVRVSSGSRSVTAPVWDVGPWNTQDDYWNPANLRQRFTDLPQFMPEAQAAYYNGYNGGRDGSGRTVLNPAGIDLADGTFWDDLGLTNNAWITVDFLWMTGSDTTPPTVNITSPCSSSCTVNVSNVNISGAVTDSGGSGLDYVYVDNPATNSYGWDYGPSGNSGTYTVSTVLTPGVNTIYAQSYDLAGNYSTAVSVNVTYQAVPACYTLTPLGQPSNAGYAVINSQYGCNNSGFASGSSVAISATAYNGYQFSYWTASNCSLGNANSSATTCTMSGAGDATVTANFITVQQCFVLTAFGNPSNAGYPAISTNANCNNGSGYSPGTPISITAMPYNGGWQFSSWNSSNCTLANAGTATTTCTVSGTGNPSVTANFSPTPPPCFGLTAGTSPASGGAAFITTGTNCAGGYTSGTAVSIVAAANSGYQFSHWNASNCALQDPNASSTMCTITGVGTATVTAIFSAPCSPTAIYAHPGSGTIAVGQSAAISVLAYSGPLSYQWYRGGSGDTSAPIVGATTNMLTVAPTVTTAYWTRVSNACSYTDSGTATINVVSSLPYVSSVVRSDLNGDGMPDLLWRYYGSGENYVWFMTGPARSGGQYLPTVPDTNWHIEGVGDFNRDGWPDILWRYYPTGENYVWYMSGPNRIGGAYLPTEPDVNWVIGGLGDFNGDSYPDIVWRNKSTGENRIWIMTGTTLTGVTALPTITESLWRMQVVGDLNNDGAPDIIWRYFGTGENYVWFMRGTVRTGGQYLPIIPDINWQIAAIADLDGNGSNDLIWRYYGTGENYVWFMSGPTKIGGQYLPQIPDVNWRMSGPR